MDDDRFDALTRALTANSSRRHQFSRLTAALLLALPAAFRNDAAEAKPCPPCRKKRHGKCHRKRRNGAPCGNGGRCHNGHCDHNVCTLDCTGPIGPQPCGPAGAGCQCVNVVEGESACVKQQGDACGTETVCDPGQICGIPCTTYNAFCWAPCV